MRPPGRVRNAHFPQHLDRIRPGLFAPFFLMAPDGLGNLVAHRIDRIETGLRLLKNHSNFLPANLPHLVFTQRRQVPPIKNNFTTDDFALRGRNQAHN